MKKDDGKKKGPFYMAGTDGTGEYGVLGRTGRGRVGVRDIGNGHFRIRVEPFSARFVPKMAEVLSVVTGWKQPGEGGQNRFSKVVSSAELKMEVKFACSALGFGTLVSKKNSEVPTWAKKLMAK